VKKAAPPCQTGGECPVATMIIKKPLEVAASPAA
jgi:hypothetical protein